MKRIMHLVIFRSHLLILDILAWRNWRNNVNVLWFHCPFNAVEMFPPQQIFVFNFILKLNWKHISNTSAGEYHLQMVLFSIKSVGLRNNDVKAEVFWLESAIVLSQKSFLFIEASIYSTLFSGMWTWKWLKRVQINFDNCCLACHKCSN